MGCGASKVIKPFDTGNINQKYAGHLGLNSNISFSFSHNAVNVKALAIKQPASVAMIFDSGSFDMPAGSGGGWCQNPSGFYWYIPGYRANAEPDATDIWPWGDKGSDRIERDAIDGRHPNKGVNVIFVDGHIENLPVNGKRGLVKGLMWKTYWYVQ